MTKGKYKTIGVDFNKLPPEVQETIREGLRNPLIISETGKVYYDGNWAQPPLQRRVLKKIQWRTILKILLILAGIAIAILAIVFIFRTLLS